MSALPPYIVHTKGRIEGNPRHSSPGTKQGHIMLLHFHQGCGWFESQGKTRHIVAPMIGLITPQFPSTLWADRDDPYFHSYMRFNGEWALKVAHEIIAEQGDFFFQHCAHQRIAQVLAKVMPTHRHQAVRNVGNAELHLAHILSLLQKSPTESKKKALSADDIHAYCQDYLDTPICLQAMADYFNIHKGSLSRSAKKLLGESVVTYWERHKINWSKNLLLNTTLHISEIAHRIGYADPFYFSRVFKRHLGKSPKQWRKQ